MKILITENNDPLRESLVSYLCEQGFAVDVADDGQEALNKGLQCNYDLIIMDVMLPGLYGWDILKGLSEVGKPVPTLMLSSRDSAHTPIHSSIKANDHLTNPIQISELVSRIHSAKRPQARQLTSH